ncbi:hypothetical protein [Wolbachia endosymbiont of Ctenocephalides felis wCfeT]|uniref:hypothetical protein n=1 Tax=Wolbachia endosymbiont of Ctenocephalides felis wCfeT TaxID=2732593 RepID=UPI001444F417|nr:hypothetical protein [Wolbachia endosymbiont of Ctenocephalides felis wCfeT]
MTAKIKLKKLTGITVNGKKAVTIVSNTAEETLLDEGIRNLANDQEIVIVGQDYKGTFTITDSGTGKGSLKLHLERPENCFTITGIKINKSGANALTNNGKDATIALKALGSDKITIIEKDNSWFTTGLTLNGIVPVNDPQGISSSLKFGEWNDYDLPDKCYVDISFS